MIKYIFLLIIFYSISCKNITNSQFNNLETNNGNMEIYCKINKNKIEVNFENKGNENILISDLCPINTRIYVLKDGKALTPLFITRPDPNCLKKQYLLKAHEKKILEFAYNIDDLYTLEKGQEYNLKIEYSIFDKGKIQDKIISKEYSFIY